MIALYDHIQQLRAELRGCALTRRERAQAQAELVKAIEEQAELDRAFDRARFFYQWTFGLDVEISDADGWLIYGDPLTDALSTVNVDHPTNEAIPIIFDSLAGD